MSTAKGNGQANKAEVVKPAGPPLTYEELTEAVSVLLTICKAHWLDDRSLYTMVANVVGRSLCQELMDRIGVDVIAQAAMRGIEHQAEHAREQLCSHLAKRGGARGEA